MLIEGRGVVAPAPVKIAISRVTLRFLEDEARKRDVFRGYARRADGWGRGFVKNPTLIGLAGEYALSTYLNRRGVRQWIDLSLRPLGDGGQDVVVFGLVCQVKTRRKGMSKRSLVRRVDDRKRIRPLACDLFVCAQWYETQPSEPVLLLGWVWAEDVRRKCALERSPIGGAGHWNLRIPDTSLRPMVQLTTAVQARQQRASA